MNFENNLDFECQKKTSRCCPKVIFAILPNTTNTTNPTTPNETTSDNVNSDNSQNESSENVVTPTLTIGTVTTGAPGSEASASITGDSPNFVLNLTIPQGMPNSTENNI